MNNPVSSMRRLGGRLRPRRRPRLTGQSFNRLIPNIMTMLGLCAGLTGMRLAVDQQWQAAVACILVAGVIDGLDGRLARLLNATSRFGAEFDSLSDFLCFGVAPAFVLYLWSLTTWGALGFVPCMMYAVCIALRLARFNAALESAPLPAYAYNFFTGVPAPLAALLVMIPMYAGLEAARLELTGLEHLLRLPLLPGVVLVVVALLAVSTLPIWSFKNFKVPSKMVLPLLLGAGIVTVALISEPWATLALLGAAYLCMLPFSVRSYRSLKREAEAARNMPVIVPEADEEAS